MIGVPAIPLSLLGPLGVTITEDRALFLLSTLAEGASAIIALVLTANILFTQLQTYALPVRFLLIWDRGTKVTYTLLAFSALLPVVLIMLGAYALSDVAVVLFATTLVALGAYVRSRPRTVSLDRFFVEIASRPELQRKSSREVYHMCLAALDKGDLDTFRKASLVLFAVDEESEAVYQFWNNLLERAQDDPAALTPLAEAIYVCSSPIATTYLIDVAAPGIGRGGTPIVNPLFSPVLAEQAPHYLARLLLLTEGIERGQGALVQQEVVENMLLLVLDLLASCAEASQLAPLSDGTVPALLGYLQEEPDNVLLPILSGDGVYHYLLFDLPGAERFPNAMRRRLSEYRHQAWDRIVNRIYYDHGWSERPALELALWRDGGEEPDMVRGRPEIESIIGPPGSDGLRCESNPSRKRMLLHLR